MVNTGHPRLSSSNGSLKESVVLYFMYFHYIQVLTYIYITILFTTINFALFYLEC